jgi:hypothetical protein
MPGANQPSTLTTDPDPSQAAPAMPAAIGRVLSVVRKLIDYGKQLADTLQQRATAPDFARFASRFGTADVALILARITNGLLRATALETKLCQRAERGQDLTSPPMRFPDIRGPRPARQVAPPSAHPEPDRTDDTQDPRLARLPTADEIAAEVRIRPVGAVIADICRDLGIAPGELDRAFWEELNLAIISYGGTYAGVLNDLIHRSFAFTFGDHADTADRGPPEASPQPPALATGPPS